MSLMTLASQQSPIEYVPAAAWSISRLVMHQLNDCQKRQLIHREQEHHDLLDMLIRFGRDGQCNSLVVSGPPGSGKSALVDSALAAASEQRDFRDCVIVVRLNGLEHADDRTTLQAIARTLRVESDIEGRVFSGTNEQLHFIVSLLQSGSSDTQRVLFVLEELDLFAQRKGQSLLYTILDVAQSRVVPVCLLGVTSRVNVGEMLEKRVKSRFSHRLIRLNQNWSLEQYIAVAKSLLHLPVKAPAGATASDKADYQRRVKLWNTNVDTLLRHDDSCRVVLLRHLQMFGSRPGPLISLLSLPIAFLPELEEDNEVAILTSAALESAQQSMLDELYIDQLRDLSIIELCLCIAANHVDSSQRPVSFDSVYAEYVRFCRSKHQSLLYERDLVRRAFDALLEAGLMTPAGGGGSGDIGGIVMGRREQFVCLVPADILQLAVNKYPNCPVDVKQWAAKRLPR